MYQDPQKVGFSGTTGPTDHSFDRTGCQLHTDLKYQYRPDINSENLTKLPVALKTVENCTTFNALLSFIQKLTLNLGRTETIPFHLHMIRYMCGNGTGWRSDGLRLTDRQYGYRMRLVLNLGESRKIHFRENQVTVNEIAYGSEDNSELARDNHDNRRYPGLGFEIMTIPGFSAYLMSSHGNGGCFLSYTNESKKVAIQAQHSVTKIGENEGGSGAFVCDFVIENLRAAMQALNDFRGMVLVNENDDNEDDDAAEDNGANVSE